ncbi:MAG: mannose-1-phosphate guanylyltransferase/mannose-6-phosphate isomerase [Hyphomicrobiaceae bacterium]
MSSIYPVILSGGSGTRLWPLSRAMYPKQFIPFHEVQPDSFLVSALRRLPVDDGFAPPTLLCNNDHRFLARDEIAKSGIATRAIILEPVARNTAAAIAVAALSVVADDADGILIVMPSDHVIRDEARFREAVKLAARVAESGRLVLFGIRAHEPHTGYGYIRQGKPLDGYPGAFEAAGFFEKPDAATAATYLADGGYHWNSGIFVFRAQTLLDEMERHAPAVLAAARKTFDGAKLDLGFLRLDKAALEAAPSISIDYAVMERTKAAAVVPVDMGWNDVGSWSSLWDVAHRDRDGNVVTGDAILEDTHDSFVHSGKALVATVGVKDLVIVDTADALLVADRARAQDVSRIVARLRDAGRPEHERHVRSYRPWGFFETLSIAPRFQVKLLHVNPGGKLSLQMHHHRSEHWVVVQGTARVIIGDIEKLVGENESVYIVATQWHRLENPGKVPLEIIEVQIGSYLGEDDIVRSDDIYRRTPDETK